MKLLDSAASNARRVPFGLALALACYVLTRGLVLATAFDEVGLSTYEVNPMGTLAEMYLRGIRVPAYFFYDNAGGQVLAGYLTVPAFFVFGSSYLALKLLPFLMGVGTLLLVHSLLRNAFGRTSALLGAWLVVLAPTTFFKYSLVCGGNHFENVFFTSIVLWIFYRAHGRGVSTKSLFCLGLASGFSIFVFLGALIPVGILAGMHVGIRGPRRSLRDLTAVLPGLLLGVSPLVALNALTHGRGAAFLAAKFGEGESLAASTLSRVPGRIETFLGVRLPESGAYPSFAGLSGATLGWIFTLAFVVAYFACVPSAWRGLGGLIRGLLSRAPGMASDPRGDSQRFEAAKRVPMVLCLPLYALAFGFSNLAVYDLGGPLGFSAYRYFLPYLLFAILALAVVCARGVERGGPARAGAVVLYAAALLPGASNLSLVDWTFSHYGSGARYDGYDLSKIGRALLSERNQLSQPEILEFLDRFPPLLRARVARALGFNLAIRQVNERHGRGREVIARAWIDLDLLTSAYAAPDRVEIVRGAGIAARFLQSTTKSSPDNLLSLLANTLEQATPEVRQYLPACLEGAASPNPNLSLESRTRHILGENQTLLQLCAARNLPPEIAVGLARGDGFLSGRLLRRGIPGDLREVSAAYARIPEPLRPSFVRGLGAGCAEGGDEPAAPKDLTIAESSRAEFWTGFATTLQAVYGAQAEELASQIGTGLAAEDLALLRRALAGE